MTKNIKDKEEKNFIAQKEEEILDFWKKNNIFKKTLEKPSPEGDFVFYEGPPTANARPGIHHLEARAFKDAIPRYKTMRGFRVERKAGWDTHGLPVELEVEKTLGLKSKKEIEKYGIEKFNEECRKNVWKYVDEWEKFSERMGYWLDFQNPYITYTSDYIESVWNILSKADQRELLYKDYKVVPWCPRCGTALSSHELAQGYEEDTDLSVTVKFKIIGFPDAYFLAWTTTPWTLPGNVALAVGKDIVYVEAKVGKDIYVLAKEKLSVLTEEYEVVAEHWGSEMVGMQYEPLYPFLKDNLPADQKDKLENAFKVYSADFVTTEDGTGIVHTAVMYGQDDFELGSAVGLPKHHLVDDSGHFTEDTGKFAGKFVKDEGVAVDIIKDLAHRSLLFKKEKHKHQYPHCWRCKTPLIYYARDSWYIKMSDLRHDLISENEKINWEPEYIRDGRFGEWLREVKDWAISRERYWGTPLPIWVSEDGERMVVDSVESLKKFSKKSNNKYLVLRHGEAEHNVLGICSSDPKSKYGLTEKGREEVKKSAEKIKKIDRIYSSPFERTKESAQIVAEVKNFKAGIVYDDRLGDIDFGEFDGKPFNEFLEFEKGNLKSYEDKITGGESYLDAKRRFAQFLYEIDSKHQNETILFVSHGIASEVLLAAVEGADNDRSKEIIETLDPQTGSVYEFDFVPLPHNENFEIDLHRPFIDEIILEKNGKEFRRVKEVMDVWFDSGAMPFAQYHYPFENVSKVDNGGYPADYISEAIDQTRGWFYTLHAIGAILGRGRAFKNVVCLGHILDKEGLKMSKSRGNTINPWTAMDEYGADVLRFWMYSVNQPGESKNFDERGVDEVVKKVFNLFSNVVKFYEMYATEKPVISRPENVGALDRWIISSLDALSREVTRSLDQYKLLEATRYTRDFIADLSQWYLRRSRDRFKSENENDKNDAIATLGYIIRELSKILAPFTPFFAEDIYQRVTGGKEKESVHLDTWPSESVASAGEVLILEEMKKARDLVSLALEARMKAGIKVRQPLGLLKVGGKSGEFSDEVLEIIKDEVNIKEIIFDSTIGDGVALDTTITKELEEEGIKREVIRNIQEKRKELELTPATIVSGIYQTTSVRSKVVDKFKSEIIKTTNLNNLIVEVAHGEEDAVHIKS